MENSKKMTKQVQQKEQKEIQRKLDEYEAELREATEKKKAKVFSNVRSQHFARESYVGAA